MHIRHDMVACFVIRPNAAGAGWEFLQLHRRAGDFMGGTWQTIYGQTHPGETPSIGALREVREETSLVPAEFYQLNDVDVFYIPAGDTLWHCINFCAVIRRGDQVTLNDEHDDFRWLSETEAQTQYMWPGNRRAVQEIREQILGNGIAKPFMRVK
jgi:dihydroneopterin triphosphate diphosphatase